MILPTGGVKIVVATTPIDFRRGINGLVRIPEHPVARSSDIRSAVPTHPVTPQGSR